MNFTELEKLVDESTQKEVKKGTWMLEKLEEKLEFISDTYVYIKSLAKYYWVEAKIFFSPSDTCSNLLVSPKELWTMRWMWIIPSYDKLCYKQGWIEGCYNLLDENSILEPSSKPELHPDIKLLIDNVCGNKEENIEYLHKAILYKFLNINDHTIPAIVLYGQGGSGKWTLISLLSTIFWEENVLGNLWQRDLTGWFDTYRGQKLIVEFAEISTHNTHTDIWVLNKLKNIIGAKKITVNEKGVRQYQTENIAWFFISSNSNKPLQLDDRDKGNRRFTIIKSECKLQNGKSINISVRDKETVANYLAWLLETYPDVSDYISLEALDNEDKKELEERSLHEANQFWEWLEWNFPDYHWKKKASDIDAMIWMFCNDSWTDERDFKKYFWSNSKYPKKRIRLGQELHYGVDIPERQWVTIEEVEEIFS